MAWQKNLKHANAQSCLTWKGEAKADAGTLVWSLPPWPEADDSESGHDMEGNWMDSK